MKKMKMLLSIILSVMVALSASIPSYATNLTIEGINLEYPDTWDKIDYEENDDSTTASFMCGKGGLQITVYPYEEDLKDFSSMLFNSVVEGLKSDEDYEEDESSDTEINGKTSHIASFYYQDNIGTMIVIDTGNSIAELLYLCPTVSASTDEFDELIDVIDSITFDESNSGASDDINYTKYNPDFYKVGTDIPSGEYILFAKDGYGYFCVSPDSNQDDITFNENFDYNSFITINDGEYLELYSCYAIPVEENPEIDLSGPGMFRVGIDIPAGEYKLAATDDCGYYCIYPDSRQDDIISNDIFENQNYVTVSNGQYLVLSGCKFTEIPEKPVRTYTDPETVKKVQEALNAAGYDCGTPDGIAGSGTTGKVEKYQTDNGLKVTGTITDELLDSLGI